MNKNNQAGWTPISNTILSDKALSFKAKALLTYLKSKPALWSFAVWRIQQEMLEGEASIRSGLKELRNAGFLSYKPKFNEQGKPNGMHYIITKDKAPKGWTAIPNIVLCDSNISLKAKGLWAYIHSKTKSWEFATHRIQNQTKERKGSIHKGLKELRENGYLRYEIRRGKDGRANGSYYILNDIYTKNKSLIQSKDTQKSKTLNCNIQSKTKVSNNHISKNISIKKNIKKKFEYNVFEAKIENMVSSSLFMQAKQKYFNEMNTEDTKFRLKVFYTSYPNAKLTSVIEYLTNMNLINSRLLRAKKRAEKLDRNQKDKQNQYKESYQRRQTNFNLRPGMWHPSQIKFKDKITDKDQEQKEKKYILDRFNKQVEMFKNCSLQSKYMTNK